MCIHPVAINVWFNQSFIILYILYRSKWTCARKCDLVWALYACIKTYLYAQFNQVCLHIHRCRARENEVREHRFGSI